MATKRIKDLTATATKMDLISENYGVLDTSGITKKVPGYLLGGGSGEGNGIVYITPTTTFDEVTSIVSSGKLPVMQVVAVQGYDYFYPSWIGSSLTFVNTGRYGVFVKMWDNQVGGWTDVEIAIGHDHTHDNKSILDEVTAPYTAEEQAKLAGIEAGARVNVIENVQVAGTDLQVNEKTVNIPDASTSTKGVVKLTSDIDSVDVNAAITPAAVKEALRQVDGKLALKADQATLDADMASVNEALERAVSDLGQRIDTKVGTGHVNNVASFDSAGNLKDSGITASDVATSVQNSHSHSNKAVLDEIPVRNGTDSAMLYSADDSSSIAWKNWSYVTVSNKTTNSVLIGKTWYPYVKIGNYYWTTENLREPIGALNADYRIYKSETVDQRGYLYAKRTLLKTTYTEPENTEMEESDALLALLHDGWHLPAAGELRQLKDLEDEYGGHEFFAIDAFDVGGVVYNRQPTDKYGFKGYPSGYYIADSGGYLEMSNFLCFASKTAAYNGRWKDWYLNLMPGSYTNLISDMNKNAFLSVRLCKRAT